MAKYPDKLWRAAYEEALRLAQRTPVLVPQVFGEAHTVPYSAISSAKDFDIIVAHKDALLSFPKWLIMLLPEYETVFENDVFFVLCSPKTRKPFQIKRCDPQAHLKDIMRCVSGLGAQLDFVHIPKTAGTSVTRILQSTSIGYQYFSSHQELTGCSDINAYSTVAGHFYLSILLEKRAENLGEVFTIIRNPIERFVSAIGHARRPDENPDGFGPSMKAMRTLSLMEFMDTKFAGMEVAQTSWMLGHPNTPGSKLKDRFSLAESYVRDGLIKIFHQSNLAPLAEYLRQMRNHIGGVDTLNQTKNKAKVFSADEQAFLNSEEFQSYFRDEVEFYKMLSQI